LSTEVDTAEDAVGARVDQPFTGQESGERLREWNWGCSGA